MLKIKKILGILLAVCFLMSVTVGAASADAGSFVKKSVEVKKVTVIEKEKKFGEEKKFGDRHEREHGWGEREHHQRFFKHHRHFHPGHWEKHKFPHHKEFNHGKWIVIYEYKQVFVKSYWTEDNE